jgi:hypothetical protein
MVLILFGLLGHGWLTLSVKRPELAALSPNNICNVNAMRVSKGTARTIVMAILCMVRYRGGSAALLCSNGAPGRTLYV